MTMDKDNFQKYLNDRYYDQINWYDQKSISNQRVYKKLQFSLIVLSSLTPILIIIEKLEMARNLSWLFWLPASTAVVVAIIASLIKTFRFQESWINYRTTCETLKKEKYLYDAEVGEYQKVEGKEALFVERVESLISRENTLWIASQKPAAQKKTGAN